MISWTRREIKMLNVLQKIMRKTKFNFEYIDLGGGMGVDYKKNNEKLNIRKYSFYLKTFLKKNSSKIIYIKQTDKKDFIIIDAAMNDLMRPALYNAEHKIAPTKKSQKKTNKIYEFVGPICETTDKFSTIKNFQKLYENDFIVICDVGAYGMSLSSNYNLRPKPAEVLIKGSKVEVISKRQSLKDLM